MNEMDEERGTTTAERTEHKEGMRTKVISTSINKQKQNTALQVKTECSVEHCRVIYMNHGNAIPRKWTVDVYLNVRG